MDVSLLRQNGAEAEPPAYEIRGDAVDFTEDARLKISCEHPTGLKLAKLLREKLALTRKEFDALVADGVLRLENGADIRHLKMQSGVEVFICAKMRKDETASVPL